jgi:hypothetical protein
VTEPKATDDGSSAVVSHQKREANGVAISGSILPDQTASSQAQIDTLWLGQAGFAYLAANVPGSRRPTDWMQWFFEWPQQSHKLLEQAATLAATKEVYIGVLLHDSRDGEKESCQASYWLWADIDGSCDQAKVEELGGMVIESGSAGHLHVYVRLAQALDWQTTEVWNRRLAKWLGADSKWHANAVLRLAGTINHKPTGGPVRLVSEVSRFWTLEELEGILPAVPASPRVASTPLPEKPPELDAKQVIAQYEHHVSLVDGTMPIRDLFELEPPGTWSDSLWRLAQELYDAGANEDERLAALQEAACNKGDRDAKGDEWLWVNYVLRAEQRSESATVAVEVTRPATLPTLDAIAYRGLAGEVVRAILPYTEADPAALLLVFLVRFGNAVGTGPHFWLGGKEHPPRINCWLVGGTSEGKKGTAQAEIDHLFSFVSIPVVCLKACPQVKD